MNYLIDYVGLVWGGGENQGAMVALPTLFYNKDLTCLKSKHRMMAEKSSMMLLMNGVWNLKSIKN